MTFVTFLLDRMGDMAQNNKAKQADIADFFTYEPRLIVTDLRKTVVVSLVILLVLLLLAMIYTQ